MDDNVPVPALILKIQALLDTMSKSERCVCQYIIDHPEDVVHLSVSDLAEASGVSSATVIRASQKIGSESYQDLKISLAQCIVTPLQAINESVSDNDSYDVILEKVFQSNMQAVENTYHTLNTNDIVEVARRLVNAKKIAICGLGNSHTVAMDLQHKMLRLGLNAIAYEDGHLQIIGATFVDKDDVMVCISHSGSSKDIVKAGSIAKKNGAFVVGLTSLGSSPLSEVCDVTLFTASNETQYRAVALSSRVAQLTIVDAIYTVIALMKKDSIDGFFRLETNLSETKY